MGVLVKVGVCGCKFVKALTHRYSYVLIQSTCFQPRDGCWAEPVRCVASPQLSVAVLAPALDATARYKSAHVRGSRGEGDGS